MEKTLSTNMKAKSKNEIIALVSLFAAVFGILVLLNNPINFAFFPTLVSASSWAGVFLLVIGLLGLYYGLKD